MMLEIETVISNMRFCKHIYSSDFRKLSWPFFAIMYPSSLKNCLYGQARFRLWATVFFSPCIKYFFFVLENFARTLSWSRKPFSCYCCHSGRYSCNARRRSVEWCTWRSALSFPCVFVWPRSYKIRKPTFFTLVGGFLGAPFSWRSLRNHSIFRVVPDIGRNSMLLSFFQRQRKTPANVRSSLRSSTSSNVD